MRLPYRNPPFFSPFDKRRFRLLAEDEIVRKVPQPPFLLLTTVMGSVLRKVLPSENMLHPGIMRQTCGGGMSQSNADQESTSQESYVGCRIHQPRKITAARTASTWMLFRA